MATDHSENSNKGGYQTNMTRRKKPPQPVTAATAL